MAIKGSLREASLPDVLQLLSMGQKTGCLSVTDRSNFGSIYFERGRVTYAMIVNRPDRLGDLLVRNGLLDPGQLASAVKEQEKRPGTRFGEILIERGAISREQLEQYVRIQIEEAVYHLFTWSQGSFYFEADERPDEGTVLASMNPENLLLEGARRVDEWTLIEKKIPSFDLVFATDAENVVAADTELTGEQRTVLALLDGNRSVREVIDESGLVEFEAGKAIFGLLQAGFVRPAGRKRLTETSDFAPTRIDEHRNLGVAFYRTGMYEEAIREFRQVAELHPENLEARFILGLIALRKGDDRMAVRLLKGIVQRGGPRASVFGGIALALERLGRMEDARLATEEALRLAPRHLALLLSHAIVLLKTERIAEAREAFPRYRAALGERADPPAAYYVFAMLAEAAAGHSDAALRLGEEGLALHPGSAPLLLHLGAVWERQGEWEVAETMYRRAVEEDAELAQAQKALADARYRRGALGEAADGYRAAIKLAPTLGGDMYFQLGNIHYKRTERDAAVRLWKRSLELNPGNTVARTNLELVEKVAR